MQTHEYKVEDFRKVLDINVTGVFIVLKGMNECMDGWMDESEYTALT